MFMINLIWVLLYKHRNAPLYFHRILWWYEARGGAVGTDTALQAGKSRVQFPSGRAMALVSTQSPIEISTRNISWGVKEVGV